MSVSGESEINNQLFQLQLTFKDKLPEKMDEILNLAGLITGHDSEENLQTLHRAVHSLTGAGGTFGATVVSNLAHELEKLLKSLLDINDLTPILWQTHRPQLDSLLSQLLKAAEVWQPSKIPYIAQVEQTDLIPIHENNLIYFAEDDPLLAADIIVSLELAGYEVRHFLKLDDFESAFVNEVPGTIIMDMIFSEGEFAGAERIEKIKNTVQTLPPIIFISIRDDIEARLAAARSGACRYFQKPVKTKKLITTVDALTGREAITPYHVLLVDDDEQLLEHYKTILTSSGLVVETLSKPLNGLELISKFRPDIVVMDVYMPLCSGPELAQVIRQDDEFALMPIMFLSTESDLNKQLTAMNLGGDDFLVKPIEAGHFVSAIIARAKRSRWTSRLNKELNDSLRESMYQLTTMNQHEIVSTADIAGRITSVNEKFCEISGFSREELLGQNHRILKSGYHPDSFYNELWKSISSGQVWRGIVCNHKKNGEEYWVESTIVPFLDENGKPYKYVSARTDITALRQSERRLYVSQEFANIGTWDWNILTGKLFWSDRIWPLFGYDKKDTDTTYENFMAAIHSDDQNRVSDAVNNCVEKGAKYDIEHRVVWPDGSTHWLHEQGDVVRDKNNIAIHMLGVVQDITLRKNNDQALIDATEEAENANRAKSQFLSSMSHELRTPMNAIMGFSQVLQLEGDEPLSSSQKESVNEILKASEHLLQLINEVLDLSKIDAGRIDLSIENVLLGEVITESLQLISPLADKRGIEITIQDEHNKITLEELLAQKLIIRADHTRIKQVILNLLSNAVKYNIENGKIILKYAPVEDHQIRISIIDTGKGLTHDEQSQLFTAFNRLGAENSNIEGTGIGLVITRNIVELMGGYIGVESTLGEGSIFWFDLPAGSVIPSESEYDKNSRAQPDEMAKLKAGTSILYIEDNPANLRLVTRLLSRLPNIHMWSAHEPLLGLELATEHQPDLILLDINLPGINGFEVLEHLRARDETRSIPVIAISANAMPQDISKGLNAGFDDYITKPINISSFLTKVGDKLSEIKKS